MYNFDTSRHTYGGHQNHAHGTNFTARAFKSTSEHQHLCAISAIVERTRIHPRVKMSKHDRAQLKKAQSVGRFMNGKKSPR